MQFPTPRATQALALHDVLNQTSSMISHSIFIPNIWLWIDLFLILVTLTIWKANNAKLKIAYIIMALFGASQIFLIIYLSFKYFMWG